MTARTGDRSSARRRVTDVLTAASGSIAVAGMVATPLSPRGGATRRVLSNVVIAGLGGVTSAATTRRWGGARSAAAATIVSMATLAVERVGVRTGIPFGRYRYTGALRPTVVGVPAVVPVAWFAMAVPAREAAHAALGARSTPVRRLVLGAAALTAWDLFLDPQMVGEGYWSWARRGRYRGIPLSNFAGWFVTGLGVMALLELLLPPAPTTPPPTSSPAPRAADPVLVGTYAYMAVMETLGFAVFFRDRRVAAVGGAGMLPLATVAARRVVRTVRARRG